jgi:hypothetical protein
VFAFVESHEFARRDFPQSGYNVHGLSRDMSQVLLHQTSLPAREIEEAAEWKVGTIERTTENAACLEPDLSVRIHRFPLALDRCHIAAQIDDGLAEWILRVFR